MELQEYIQTKHKGKPKWFVEEVKSFRNQDKIREVQGIKEYLNGNHKITQAEPYEYKGKLFYPKKIVIQLAKTIFDFHRQYILSNPISLVGDEEVIKQLNKINRRGKYQRTNRRVLDMVMKYGNVYEYVYKYGNSIKSKLIGADTGFPIYSETNDMIAFIEHYKHDGVEYYNVFTEDTVESYKYEGRRLQLIGRHANLTGLPIAYVNENPESDTQGRSLLEDWISILDAMEELISKYQDSVYKFIDPIPVVSSQQLKDSLPSEVTGKGLLLDDGSTFSFEGNKLDYQSFESVWNTLMQSLLDVSSTPAIALNKAEIANVSTTSIKMLFSLADTKASINSEILKEGIEQRHDRFRTLLEYDGITFDNDAYDTVDLIFNYNIPSNDAEKIENLKTLREIGGISLESLLEQSPYTPDNQVELERLRAEGNYNNEQKEEQAIEG